MDIQKVRAEVVVIVHAKTEMELCRIANIRLQVVSQKQLCLQILKSGGRVIVTYGGVMNWNVDESDGPLSPLARTCQ
jgi:hypothetical protein